MTSNSNSPEFGGIKTTLPLTAEQIANNWCWDNGYPDHKMAISIASLLKAYVAQKNAELVAENERLKTCVQLFDEQGDRILEALNKEKEISAQLQAENERLKQQVITLRDAIAKKLSQNDTEGFCLLEAYNATQPPKEAP